MAKQPDNTGIGVQRPGGPGPKYPTNVVTDAPAPPAQPAQPAQQPTPLNQLYPSLPGANNNATMPSQEEQFAILQRQREEGLRTQQALEQEFERRRVELGMPAMNQQQPAPPVSPTGGSQTMPEQSAVMPDGTVVPLPQGASQGPYTAPQIQERTVEAPVIDYTQFDPTTQNVTEDQLVSSQLQGLLASDSPYMRQAALAAERQAASRGLLSSSMAAGASQAAAMQAAMPIAAANAQAYQRAASENAAAINNANLAKLESVTNMASSQLASMTNLATTAMDAESRGKIAALSANAQTLVSQMQITAQKDMQMFQSEHDKILELQRQNGRVESAKLDFGFRNSLMRDGFAHELNMEAFRQEGQMNVTQLSVNAQMLMQERGIQGQFNLAELDRDLRRELFDKDASVRERMMGMQHAHNFDMSQFNAEQQERFMSLSHANTLNQMEFAGSQQDYFFNKQAQAAMVQQILGAGANFGAAAVGSGMDPQNSVASTVNFMAFLQTLFPEAFTSSSQPAPGGP